jgi:Tfp pilus assembly protein PilP
MRKNIKNYSFLAAALAVITIGSSVMAHAETNTTTVTSAQIESTVPADMKKDGRNHKGGFGLNQNSLESLVSNGTIDQATADKITAYMKTMETKREEERTKIDAMTEAERKEYLSAEKDQKKGDPFSGLVSQEIITQTQADSIKAAMPNCNKEENGEKGDKGERRGFGFIENELTSLVTDGTIDQEAADEITAYVKTLETERETEKTKVDAMTEAERQEYFSTKKDETRVDLFTDLVNKGIVTQTQADAIKAAMPERHSDNSTTSDTAS